MQNIGFGTAAIGRPQYINIRQEATASFDLNTFKNEGIKTLDEAYALGIRYYDTAPGYGIAEKLLIEWAKQKNDPSVEIATKWGYRYVANFDPNAKVHEIKDHTIDLLSTQWEQSKELLPYLTTYQIHSATFETGVLEDKNVLNKLAELKHKYNIKIGLTTTGSNQLAIIEHALDVAIDGNKLFDTFQVTYNIMDQSLSSITDVLHKENKRIIIKEALANGRIFPNTSYPQYSDLYKNLDRMSHKYQVGIDAIAMRFCMDSIKPFVTLSGASSPNQILENLRTSTFELEDEDVQLLKTFNVAPEDYWLERKQLTWN